MTDQSPVATGQHPAGADGQPGGPRYVVLTPAAIVATVATVLLGLVTGFAVAAVRITRDPHGQAPLYGTDGGGDVIMLGVWATVLAAAIALYAVASKLLAQERSFPALGALVVQLALFVVIAPGTQWLTYQHYHPSTMASLAGCPGVASVTILEAEGVCYGVLGLEPVRRGRTAPTFGRDARPSGLGWWQEQIQGANPAKAEAALTVVWVGELTCGTYHRSNPAICTSEDGGDYDLQAELEDLQGLRLAQWAQGRRGVRIRVLLANAGPHVGKIKEVAEQIKALDERGELGARRVVVNIGNSTVSSADAVRELLSRRIPVIAPTLTSDAIVPVAGQQPAIDSPFVGDPGFLQLAPSNSASAGFAVQSMRETFPDGVRLAIYRHYDSQDTYVNSLVTDLKAWYEYVWPAAEHPRGPRTDVFVVDADPETINGDRVCSAGTVLFFADRHHRFPRFVDKVNSACGESGTYPTVMADGSANRVMDTRNGVDPASDWPLLYFSSGFQCPELRTRSTVVKDPAATAFLDSLSEFARVPTAAPGTTTLPDCRKPGAHIGDHVAPFWDAVTVALALPDVPTDLGTLELTVPLTSGSAVISAGRVDLTRSPIPLIPLCVATVGMNSGRSYAQCANKVRGYPRASFVTTFDGDNPLLPLFTDRVRTGRPR